MEDLGSLFLLGHPRINGQLEAKKIVEYPSIETAVTNGYPNTLRLLIDKEKASDTYLLMLARQEPDAEILLVIVEKLQKIPFFILHNIYNSVEYVKMMKIVLASEAKIAWKDYLALMCFSIEYGKSRALDILLANDRAKFEIYHSKLMFRAVSYSSMKNDIREVKMLLVDPKGKSLPRDYTKAVREIKTKRLMKVIIIHPNVDLDENTIIAAKNKFGARYIDDLLMGKEETTGKHKYTHRETNSRSEIRERKGGSREDSSEINDEL